MRNIDPDVESWKFADRYAALQSSRRVLIGPARDDCSVVDLDGQLLVATTDFINANPIFLELGIGDFRDIGRYLVNANLSDLCGSGANPFGILTNLMWDRDADAQAFSDLLEGIDLACTDAAVEVLGGDTKLSSRTVLSATAFGSVESQESLLLMTNAQVEDGIWVSGPIGSCAAATLGLAEYRMDEDWKRWAKARVTRPVLPLDVARKVASLGMGGAGTDISDGLDADLVSLCRLSQVGAIVELDRIPVEPEVAALADVLDLEPGRFSLTIGGDLQFLVTGREEFSNDLESTGMVRIGTVVPRDVRLSTPSGYVDLTGRGHRDARGMTFVQEIRHLLEQAE